MINEIPPYGLRAYALFFSKHNSREHFKQNELDWILSNSMKKKVFSLLLRNGWIKKQSDNSYVCVNPEIIFKALLKSSDVGSFFTSSVVFFEVRVLYISSTLCLTAFISIPNAFSIGESESKGCHLLSLFFSIGVT